MFFEYICKNYYVAQDLTDDRPIFVAQSVAQQKSSELMIMRIASRPAPD